MEAAWAAWGCSGHGFLASKARSGLCCFRGFGIWGLGFRLLWFGGFRCSDGPSREIQGFLGGIFAALFNLGLERSSESEDSQTFNFNPVAYAPCTINN